jgi:hypothetical protein
MTEKRKGGRHAPAISSSADRLGGRSFRLGGAQEDRYAAAARDPQDARAILDCGSAPGKAAGPAFPARRGKCAGDAKRRASRAKAFRSDLRGAFGLVEDA